jgi:hypothetical protein
VEPLKLKWAACSHSKPLLTIFYRKRSTTYINTVGAGHHKAKVQQKHSRPFRVGGNPVAYYTVQSSCILRKGDNISVILVLALSAYSIPLRGIKQPLADGKIEGIREIPL